MNWLDLVRNDPSFKSLAQELASGECAIFVGAGLSIAAGLPSWSDLERIMRGKACLTNAYDAPRTADCCRAVIGEQNFNRLIREAIAIDKPPTDAHQRIAGLPVNVFVTTNYDTLLEQALQSQNRRYKVLSLHDTSEWVQIRDGADERLVLKIHGCISRTPNRLVITEDDYLSFAQDHQQVVNGLAGVLARRPILFLGYSLTDWHLLSVLHNVRTLTSGNSTNKYYVGVDLEPAVQRFLERRHSLYVLNLTTTSTKEHAVRVFLDALIEEFEVPTWFRDILVGIGAIVGGKGIARTTELASLFPAFDAVTPMRLALRIEKGEGRRLPMAEVMRARSVGDLMEVVGRHREDRSAGV